MTKTISFVLSVGAVLNALIDGFNTVNIIFIVLSGILLLFCLIYKRPAADDKVKPWKTVTIGAFAVYVLCFILSALLFSPANIYSFSGDTNKTASLIASGDYKKAEKLLLKQYEKDASDSAVNLNLAVVYLKKHNTDLAKRHLELATYGMYFDENLWFNFGLVYYQNKDYKNARDSFEKAVQLNPDFVNANIYAGTMNYMLGDMRRSIYHLQNAEFLKPDSSEILLHLGRSCTGLMEYDTAIDYFNKALELKPGKELEKAIKEQLTAVESAKGGAVQ